MDIRRSWESAVREFAKNKYVRKRNENYFEVAFSDRCTYRYIGAYSTEEEAHDAAIQAKIDTVRKNIMNSNCDPERVVESSSPPYLIHPNGAVFNVHGHIMHPAPSKDGYLHTLIHGKHCNIHVLMARTFIPNPNNLPCVNHRDGNKTNNAISNLEWCSYSENVQHSFDTGLQIPAKGEESHRHKLSEDQVRYIRQVYRPRDHVYGAAALARQFGVDRTTITAAFHHNTWRHI